jgi:hypothetical protein
MRRNVMIYTATTLTAIAATALGGITSASASAATPPPTYVKTAAGPAGCAIAVRAAARTYAKEAAKAAIAVPAPALGSSTEPALPAPATAIALSRACPAGACAIAVPAAAPTYAKEAADAPAGSGFADRGIVVRYAGIKDSAGLAKIADLKPEVTCPIPDVAAGAAVPAK